DGQRDRGRAGTRLAVGDRRRDRLAAGARGGVDRRRDAERAVAAGDVTVGAVVVGRLGRRAADRGQVAADRHGRAVGGGRRPGRHGQEGGAGLSDRRRRGQAGSRQAAAGRRAVLRPGRRDGREVGGVVVGVLRLVPVALVALVAVGRSEARERRALLV